MKAENDEDDDGKAGLKEGDGLTCIGMGLVARIRYRRMLHAAISRLSTGPAGIEEPEMKQIADVRGVEGDAEEESEDYYSRCICRCLERDDFKHLKHNWKVTVP